MERKPIAYTLKVWLWSAIMSPAISAALQYYAYHANTARIDWFMAYPLIVIAEILLTFLLWVLFWASTATCSNLIRNDTIFRWSASLIGLFITGALCWIFGSDSLFSLENIFNDLLLSNCFCIFAGCWYFNIGRPIAEIHLSTINTDAYEQATE